MFSAMDADRLTPFEALDLAVTRVGSQGALAKICDVSQPAVWKWLNESKQLPAEHVLKVEAATRVSRHDLRPDLYPRGLQDDTPYELAATLDLGADLVAGNREDEFHAAAGGGR